MEIVQHQKVQHQIVQHHKGNLNTVQHQKVQHQIVYCENSATSQTATLK